MHQPADGGTILAAPIGCTDEQDDDAEDSAGGTGGEPCTPCRSDELHFTCCAPGSNNCVPRCLPADGSGTCPSPYSAPNGRWTCDQAVAETAANWTPGSFVSQNQSGTYEIDQGGWDDLLDHPGQLLHDGARVHPVPGGGYSFTGIQSGDFFDQLGFQNGDQVSEINGRRIRTDADAWSAYNDFYSSTTFRVVVSRSGSPVSLSYEIN